MSVVAIIGAGDIGGAVARALAHTARVAAICLVDEAASVAAGKALDLRQSAPILGSDVRIASAGEIEAAAGADVIVLADPAPPSVRDVESSIALFKRLHRLGCFDQSVIVCAGAGDRQMMQQGFDDLGLSRRRLIGSAPEALAAAARVLVAVEAHVAASQVTMTVMGRPPARTVIPWTEASIAGSGATSVLSPPQITRIEQRLSGLWPPGPGALGTSAARVCEAVIGGSRRVFSAFVSLDRDNGTTAPVCAWPVSVGRQGLSRIASPTLTPRDRILVDEVLE